MMADDFTLDEFLGEYTPKGVTVRICSRGDIIEELETAAAQLVEVRADDERHNRVPEAPELARRIVELEAEARRFERPFRFVPLSKDAYSDLIAAHPPTPEQQAKARQQDMAMEWDPDSFLPALVAASCVAPRVSLDGVERIAKTVASSHWRELWQAALAANNRSPSVPSCAAAYALLGTSPPSLTTAPREESPDPSF